MRAMRLGLAFVPPLLSLAALAIVLLHLALHGTARESDEGTAAHVFQLLLLLQVPLIGYWLLRGGAGRRTVPLLALQVGAALAALAPVWWVGL